MRTFTVSAGEGLVAAGERSREKSRERLPAAALPWLGSGGVLLLANGDEAADALGPGHCLDASIAACQSLTCFSAHVHMVYKKHDLLSHRNCK